jgi:aryl-phospho-beta-D-glucosidase BglC (GH1 family)
MIGINLSGAEFGTGKHHGYDYQYPKFEDIKFYADRGVDLIRLPFTWERMQPHLGGALDQAEVGRLKTFLADAHALGVEVIVDLHNYGRYNGNPIGSWAVGPQDLADFWQKLATEIKGSPALVGYGIMNEPHDMPNDWVWKVAAQAAVNAIRQVDFNEAIYVNGNGWSGAHSWKSINNDFILSDPANNIFYEAHLYFDRDSSGIYRGNYDQEGAYANAGVDRLKPFVEWLQANNLKGFIGEFGVPSDDGRWLELQNRALDFMEANGLSGTAWGGGSWWPKDYPMFMASQAHGETAYFDLLQARMNGESHSNAPAAPAHSSAPQHHEVPASSPPPSPASHVENFSNDVINSTPGDDWIDTGEGNDWLNGSGGADVFNGGSGQDIVSYHWSGASVDVDLQRAVQLFGDAHGDRLTNIEQVAGSAHSDRIRGDWANNTLIGNGGDDHLDGAGGADVLTGGEGNDWFVFSWANDADGDRITDFSWGDVIDLRGIDANVHHGGDQEFRNIGSANFSWSAGELRVFEENGQTLLAGDVDGNGHADFTIRIDGGYHSDFIYL